MGAITDLWKSERGMVCIVSLALVTVTFNLGQITSEQWESLLKWIIGGYTAAKTVSSVVEARTPVVDVSTATKTVSVTTSTPKAPSVAEADIDADLKDPK